MNNNNINNRDNYWSLYATKNYSNYENIPKFQHYSNYILPIKNDLNKENRKQLSQNFLKTDHIGIQIPKDILENNNNNNNINNNKFSFLNMKSKFNSSSESNSHWNAKVEFPSLINKSSVNYNILTNEQIKNNINNNINNNNKESFLNKNYYFKRKGVGNYADLIHPFNKNFSEKYNKAYNENNNIFKSYKGVFSQIYEDAHRSGNIYQPFERKNLNHSNSAMDIRKNN